MNMKTKLGGILIAGGLMVSGIASAAPVACSSLATTDDWANAGSCIDPDEDMLFIFEGYAGTFPHATAFSATEIEIGNTDFYDIGFDWHPNGWTGGGGIAYTMTSLTDELISSANFDTDILGFTHATKQLFDIESPTPFLTLTSNNGQHDPIGGGEYFFPGRSSLYVVDTFDLSTNGTFLHSDNSFNATVPEPASLSLFGIGLAAIFGRRRAMVAT